MKKSLKKKFRKAKSVINLQVAPNIPAVETQVAAKAVFFDDFGRVLLIRERSDGSGTGTNPGLWDVPGGTVRSDESISLALERECIEEIGDDCMLMFDLDTDIGQIVLPSPLVMQKDPRKTRLYFPIMMKADGFKVSPGSDFDDWAFVGIESILDNSYKTVPNLTDVIVKLLLMKFSVKAARRLN